MRRTHRVAALALAAALALTACSPGAGPEAGWRDLVTRAAEQASAGDYAGAESTLATIDQEVAVARDAQRIDAARAASILAATATVRGDLAPLIPATPPPAPAPSESVSESPDPSGDEQPDTTDDGDTEDNGNEKNNGNGNGKKNKDED